eukprot:PITA_26610
MIEKTMEIISQESPQLLFVDDHFANLVKKIIIDRWNNFNTPLHTLAHALNPKFYNEELISQRNGKRNAPHKGRKVANGVKKSLMRMFLAHLHREVKEEFVSFVVGLHDYLDILALEERSTMNPIRWPICHGENGVHLQNIAIYVLSQVASTSSTERNWSTYGFIHFMKHKSGPSKEWDVDPKSPDLELSLAALNIEDRAPRSGIGQSSSSTPPSTIQHASASIFDEDYDDED